MEHLSVKKAINLARTLGVAGLLAVALVTTSGCIRTDNHQPEGQVSTSDSSQEEGAVYGKMEYSITGVEVHDSADDDGGKVAVVRWHAINNRTADSFATGSYITAYQNKQMLHGGLAADLQEDSFSSQGLAPGGECDGVSIFELNDMSPVEIKINGTSAGSNSLDQTFELE
ncbi:DUF5067 domain-containing protein [Collinsella aerofaciens]|uniref:DUF5067 domain-containing protein n=1 Tax=Collinsella aerofaciens TaxID=74426 RepID=UPI001CD5585F|nr:DUF5067 domain-containing protein [Collinsella aerofaciens]UBS36674.1 DUF5067 domain-containing protein [Collinsella aerofaciens]